ncbi:hypothetical protein [Streptomyces pacificus]|uniref:Flp family type IVb pilin n=1 Tax=Streptomyces pacificus TaxID=2705029 RepID=A0A6A0AVB0_9ACTN|nr:hypothetical protein [Streptomyces pacificus]GFH35874.1 hypothetical protein SCWH03_20960 [Streptomyces pacificus]
MSNTTIRAAINARVHLGNWARTTAEAIRHRGDRGQGAVEYVGVIVLVALIIAALVGSGVAETIAGGLSDTVNEILGG